jgi:hypothetical protein
MLTKISSLPQSKKPLDRATAVGFLVTNLTTLPGLGSVAAGRRSGYYQMGFAIVGMMMVVSWLFFFVWRWALEGEFSAGDNAWVGIVGAILNTGAWLWSLFTGLSVIRETKKEV